MSATLEFVRVDLPESASKDADSGDQRTEEEIEDEEWNRRVALAPPVKDSTTRLLDMLAGWVEYSDRDDFPDSDAAMEQIAQIYQEAGELAFALDEATVEEKRARIHTFLVDRVLPTLTT